MYEPAVTITDYILALEGAVFAALLLKAQTLFTQLRLWLVLFLVGFSVAAALGGTVHGFFPSEETLAYGILWRATLLTLGFIALAGWGMGTAIALPPQFLKPVVIIAAIEFIAYAIYVVFVSQDYLVAVLNYLPASLYVLGAFSWHLYKEKSTPALYGVCGLILTFVAAGVQTGKVSIHPVYFDYNALYHVIQGIGIVFIYMAGRGMIRHHEA